MLQLNKTFQDAQTNRSAFLGVKLGGEKIVFLEGSTKGQEVVGAGSGMRPQGRIVTVHKIYVSAFHALVEQIAFQIADLVPAHVWNLKIVGVGPGQNKFANGRVKDAQTVNRPFFTVTAHELHAQTNPQYGLGESLDEGVHSLFFRSEEHTSELQSRPHLVCRLLLEKKNRTDTSV